jgi:PAS domain S-box-containing protein
LDLTGLGIQQTDPAKEWLPATADRLGFFADVFDALPMAIYTTDADGRIVFFNAAAAALFGTEPVKGVWTGARRLFWPDGAPMGETPMSIAIKERRAIRGAEGLIEGPEGALLRVLIFATPLFQDATVIGGVNVILDLGEQNRTAYLEQRLAAIVESSEDAIISKDLNGTIITWNRAAEQLFGYSAAEAIGRSVLILIPDDRQQEEENILTSIRSGRPVARYETWRKRKDGTLVPIALTVSPLRDRSGRIIGASKIARDISDQIRIREHQMLVLNEMSHRVKNVLAVAGGLIGLSARSAQNPKAMARAVQERLGAYSRAHDLTRKTAAAAGGTESTTLHTLVHAIVAPYVVETGEETNVVVEGDDVSIDANTTASLALVLHEFTTNAAKYGALSTPSGRISVTTRESGNFFECVWTERGGPAITSRPSRQGFGSVLAVRTVEGQLNGALQVDWQPEGAVISLRIPKERSAPERDGS